MTVTYHAGRRIQGTQADFDGTPAVSGGWKELARTTLGSAGDNIDITSLSDKRYYMYLLHRDTSGSTSARMTFNGDDASSNQNYSTRYASDGTEYTAINQDFVSQHTSASQDSFTCGYIANKSSNEKLVQSWIVGNASPPSRYEQFWKWDNTSNAINRIDIYNHLGGNLDIGSELVVLGWDPDDTHTDNFWEELASVDLSGGSADNLSSGTITGKKYLWCQAFLEASGSINVRTSFNNDSTTYAWRKSNDGGSETTSGSDSDINMSSSNSNIFLNMFIFNKSSNEKLVIYHTAESSTLGANAAPQRVEGVARYDNASSQITEIDIDNTSSGSYGTNSFIKVWGSN